LSNPLDLFLFPLHLSTMQAEQKTVPTNPMKELRIEKLVISAFIILCFADWGNLAVAQTSLSVNLVTG